MIDDTKHRFNMTYKHTIDKLKYAIDKGYVDDAIIPYLFKYNKLENTYTTSSCVGRILVLGLDHVEKKKPKLFVGKWHRVVKPQEVIEKLDEKKFDELWLKQEPFILHIVAKDMDGAKKILEAKKEAGIKRGGIINIKEGRIVVEILGSSYMSVPIKTDDNILFEDNQLEILVKKANQKLEKNYNDLDKFLEVLYVYMQK